MIRHHEVYLMTASGMTKVAEVHGCRRQQVDLRRQMRRTHNAAANAIVLYTDGQLARIGIDLKSG